MDIQQEKVYLNKIICKNIASVRDALNITQAELSRLSNISATFISQLESESRNVTLVILSRLAKALGVTVDFLLIKPQEAEMTKWEEYRVVANTRKIHRQIAYLSDLQLIYLTHIIEDLMPSGAMKEVEEQ